MDRLNRHGDVDFALLLGVVAVFCSGLIGWDAGARDGLEERDAVVVVLIRQSDCCAQRAWPAAELKLLEELRAMGCRVETVDGIDPSTADWPVADSTRGNLSAVTSALKIASCSGGASMCADIWLRDDPAGDVLHRQIDLGSAVDEPSAGLAAIKTVEALSAVLLERNLVLDVSPDPIQNGVEKPTVVASVGHPLVTGHGGSAGRPVREEGFNTQPSPPVPVHRGESLAQSRTSSAKKQTALRDTTDNSEPPTQPPAERKRQQSEATPGTGEDVGHRFGFALLGAVLLPLRNVGPSLSLGMAVDWRVFPQFSLAADVAASIAAQSFELEQGTASFDHAPIRIWANWHATRSGVVRPSFGIGSGVFIAWSRGESTDRDLQNEKATTASTYVGGLGQIGFGVFEGLELQVGATMGILLPEIVIRYETKELAEIGRPLLDIYLRLCTKF